MSDSTLNAHNDRWHVTQCSRCLASIEPGDEVYSAKTSKYEPMNPGPAWEAVGDWAGPEVLGGCLCGTCRTALQAFLMGWDDQFDRQVNGSGAHLRRSR